MYACNNGNKEIVELLLSCGAEMYTADNVEESGCCINGIGWIGCSHVCVQNGKQRGGGVVVEVGGIDKLCVTFMDVTDIAGCSSPRQLSHDSVPSWKQIFG